MKKKIIYGLLSIFVIAVAVMLSAYLMRAKPALKKDAQKHNITYVKTESVKTVAEKVQLSYRGRITAFDKVSLSSEVSGKIMRGDVRFKAGEKFRRGQVIVRIYSEDAKASLKSGKSGLLQILSRILPDIKVDYKDQYDKWMNFFKAFDVEKPLPKLPQTSSNKEKIFLATNNVLSTYYNLQRQEIILSRYTIRAPFDGTFISVNKEIGAVSNPGLELAAIIRTDKLEVTVPVFPNDLKNIKRGGEAEIKNADGVKKKVKVSRISSFVEASTQSLNVYLTLNSANSTDFLDGEYVDVNFGGESINGFKIPREALFDGNKVYKLHNNKLEAIVVNVLRQMDDYYIINGLDKETVVVTESLAYVNPDTEYRARE